MTSPVTELCTFGPPAERERRWILKFEDADVGDMYFSTEPDAMRAFKRYDPSWNCTLFVTAEYVDPDQQALARLRGPALSATKGAGNV